MDNEKPYRIIISGAETFLEYKDLSTIKLISININTKIVRSENPEILQKSIIYKAINSKAILGIININKLYFILHVTTSKVVGKMKNEIIYKIEEVEFCPMQTVDLLYDEEKKINQIKDGISKLLKLGFYYSFGLNLTNSQQNQSKLSSQEIKDNNNLTFEQKMKNIYKTVNKKYFFNYNLYKIFINKSTKLPYDFAYSFILPIICGYIGMYDYTINNKQLQFILISRRSQNYAGTRYNTRGIDDNGNVANFCETEQILVRGDYLFSFCQLRGSAPVFFEQLGITGYTDITRGKHFSKEAFSKHLEEINQDFPLVYFVNLLNQTKSGEAPIIAEFEKQIQFRLNNNDIRYTYFDMQNECQKDNYTNIDKLINKVKPLIEIFNCFSQNLHTREIYSYQKGTIRTNCLDCLDRTNIIQMRICWIILEIFFKKLNLDNQSINKIFNSTENFFTQDTKNEFKEKFKNIWAENGDEISIQYAGTASTHTTVTKTGGHSLMGLIQHGIATVSRIYQGNFEDNFKQECIDILLQKNISEEDDINPNINIKLIKRKNEYTKYQDFHIFIGNYNLSGKSIDNAIDIVNWLISYKDNPLDKSNNLNSISPEFYILGFQEIVDLNSAHLLIKSNTEKKNKIKTLINNLLLTTFQNPKTNTDKYQLMKEIDLVGLYILIFVRASCIKYIKNFDYQIIKTGLKGTLGNKGSLLLRFNLNDSSIAIACSHLCSGQEKNEERKSEIINVLNTSFKKYPLIKFKDYNYFFYFGDVNTRLNITMENEKLIDMIKFHPIETNGDFSALLQYDQFSKYQKESNIIAEMDEAEIKFSPTYKYYIGLNNYDIESRIPAWCDRIFFKKYTETTPLAYNKCILNISDHQPIYGLYKIKSEIIDQEKRQNILDEITKMLNKENNNKGDNFDNINFVGNDNKINMNDYMVNFFSPK
jgi:hypothetical protein